MDVSDLLMTVLTRMTDKNFSFVNNKGKDNSFDIYAQCQQKFPELLMQWMNSIRETAI